jgi:hypothetical protein
VVIRFAIVVGGGWALINGLAYAADFSKRYRVEAAWFLFSAVLLIAAVHAMLRGTGADARQRSPTPLQLGIAFVTLLALGVALYFPVLSLGLLSDDFVLLSHARSGRFADRSWDYLRPLPLIIWSGLNQLAEPKSVPILLHAFSIALHATNAWLAALLATRWGFARADAFLAGLLFLVFPTAVEAVVWASAVFDLLLVTFLLTACIVLTVPVRRHTLVAMIGLMAAAALATKETAVVFPVLLALAAYGSQRVSLRQAVPPVAVSAALVLVYVLSRMTAGFAVSPPTDEWSGYAAKEILSRPFGTLALPFHRDVIAAQPWLPVLSAVFWPAVLVASSFTWLRNKIDGLRSLSLAAWILVSVAPLATMLFIADDLQGSRYLYAGTAAWSLLALVLCRTFPRQLRIGLIVTLLMLFAIATRFHQGPWLAAARERDRVLGAYEQSDLRCLPTRVRGLPDHVGGAYVFRNGFLEAVAALRPANAEAATCSLAWDGARFLKTAE